MGITARVGVAAALLCVAVAATASYVPTHIGGSTCQTWFDPGWDAQRVEWVHEYIDHATGPEGLGGSSLPIGLEVDSGEGAGEMLALCDAKLEVRKVITFSSLTLGLLAVPTAVFVTGKRRRGTPAAG
jgi:hypothetical protein